MQSGRHYLNFPHKYRLKWKRIVQPNKIKIQSKKRPFGINWCSTHSALKDQKTLSLLGAGIKQVSDNVPDSWERPPPAHRQVVILLWVIQTVVRGLDMEVGWSVGTICLEVLRLHRRDGKPGRSVWRKSIFHTYACWHNCASTLMWKRPTLIEAKH